MRMNAKSIITLLARFTGLHLDAATLRAAVANKRGEHERNLAQAFAAEVIKVLEHGHDGASIGLIAPSAGAELADAIIATGPVKFAADPANPKRNCYQNTKVDDRV